MNLMGRKKRTKYLTKDEHAVVGQALNALRNTLIDGGEFYRLLGKSRADSHRKRALAFVERLRCKLDSELFNRCPDAALPSPYYDGAPCLATDGEALAYAQHLLEHFDEISSRIGDHVPAPIIDLSLRVHYALMKIKLVLQDEEDERRWEDGGDHKVRHYAPRPEPKVAPIRDGVEIKEPELPPF
jgi:hypothetical protein